MTPFTNTQIANLRVNRNRPLLVVDADEVIVLFAAHFSKYLNKHGWELNLKGYRLDDAICRIEDGQIANNKTYVELINDFIKEETRFQPEAPGASNALELLSQQWEIIILTNVPTSARQDRIRNLTKLGMNFPVVSNSGLKGEALAKIIRLSDQKSVFIDDNPFQIESASQFVPNTLRFHFTACDIVSKTLPFCSSATHRPKTWSEILAILSTTLG